MLGTASTSFVQFERDRCMGRDRGREQRQVTKSTPWFHIEVVALKDRQHSFIMSMYVMYRADPTRYLAAAIANTKEHKCQGHFILDLI